MRTIIAALGSDTAAHSCTCGVLFARPVTPTLGHRPPLPSLPLPPPSLNPLRAFLRVYLLVSIMGLLQRIQRALASGSQPVMWGTAAVVTGIYVVSVTTHSGLA